MEFFNLTDMNEDEKFNTISTFVPSIKKISKTNPYIKHIRDVLKGKTDYTEAVVSGVSMLYNVLDSTLHINSLILCLEDIHTPQAQQVIYDASKRTDNIYCVTSSVFSMLDLKKNSNGIAVHITLQYKKISQIRKEETYLVIDSLELAGNIGTLMRTADGAGLKSIIITNPKVKLNNPTLLAASRAAFSSIDIIVDEVDNIINWAGENEIDIYLADTRADKTHTQADLSRKVCFVVGCERYGIDEKWYKKEHKLLKIPMLGKCDSLNVGVAGSILIYEALRQKGR